MIDFKEKSKKIKRIIFFIEHKFTRRDYKRFGIEILEKNGYEVLVWDFTLFIHENILNLYSPNDACEYPNWTSINSENSALKNIDLLSDEDIVVAFGFHNNYKKRKIFQKLTTKNIAYGVNNQNSLPSPDIENKNVLLKILNLLLNFKNLRNSIYLNFPILFPKINPPTFIMAGGSDTVKKKNKSTEIVWTHKMDYDLFLSSIKNKKKKPPFKKYVLCIDEYLPFHPDNIYENRKKIDPVKYYSLLTKFFKEVELREGCPVIIAAHPSSQYESHPDYYQGRSVIKDKTIELVKDCRFVITFASTSLNYAVLFNKPVIFIKMNLIADIYNHWVEVMAKNLRGKIISLDSKINENQYNDAKIINKNYFKSYKEKYIKKSGTPEINSWEIFANYLKNKD